MNAITGFGNAADIVAFAMILAAAFVSAPSSGFGINGDSLYKVILNNVMIWLGSHWVISQKKLQMLGLPVNSSRTDYGAFCCKNAAAETESVITGNHKTKGSPGGKGQSPTRTVGEPPARRTGWHQSHTQLWQILEKVAQNAAFFVFVGTKSVFASAKCAKSALKSEFAMVSTWIGKGLSQIFEMLSQAEWCVSAHIITNPPYIKEIEVCLGSARSDAGTAVSALYCEKKSQKYGIQCSDSAITEAQKREAESTIEDLGNGHISKTQTGPNEAFGRASSPEIVSKMGYGCYELIDSNGESVNALRTFDACANETNYKRQSAIDYRFLVTVITKNDAYSMKHSNSTYEITSENMSKHKYIGTMQTTKQVQHKYCWNNEDATNDTNDMIKEKYDVITKHKRRKQRNHSVMTTGNNNRNK